MKLHTLIKTLIDRVYKINSSWEGFVNDIDGTKLTLQKNEYPEQLINKNVKRYISNTCQPKTNEVKDNENYRYFKLPYIGSASGYTEKKLKQIISKFCKAETLVKVAFTPLKIASFFSTKDKILDNLRSFVVYKFTCTGCNASYVGHTTRHIITRIREHLKSDKQSHVLKHLNTSTDCKNKCSDKSFKILDSANTKFSLKIKEAIWIKYEKPNLNKQKKNGILLTLCI